MFKLVNSTLNDLLGPSIFLLVLDMFIDNPDQYMNLREIARRVDKNPGSISPIMPELLARGMVTGCKVGKVSVVYQLNVENPQVAALMELRRKLKRGS